MHRCWPVEWNNSSAKFQGNASGLLGFLNEYRRVATVPFVNNSTGADFNKIAHPLFNSVKTAACYNGSTKLHPVDIYMQKTICELQKILQEDIQYCDKAITCGTPADVCICRVNSPSG